jgi:hypothetical protein
MAERLPKHGLGSTHSQETRMNKLLTLAIAGVFACAGGAVFAADAPAAKPTNAQQERMKECNAKAEGKKGDERKAFMSSCLSGKEAPPVKMTQQEKMKACNAKAGDKKGDERKAFMSECLKG